MATGMRLCSKTIALSRILPTKMCHYRIEKMKTPRQHFFVQARNLEKQYLNRGLVVRISTVSYSDEGSNFVSLSDTIEKFYDCINRKQLNPLGEFISDDCSLEDCSFPYALEGKREVIKFFSQLIASMGKSVEFKLGNVCVGDDYSGGVTWHLEWNKKRIPFTRGCSFFKCSNEKAGLVIKKCFIVTESPMKPGGSALNLLKTVTTLFDKFPKAAEWFLKSPQELLQMMIKIYSIFFRPFLSPVIAWYIKLGKLLCRLMSHVINILIFISKILYK